MRLSKEQLAEWLEGARQAQLDGVPRIEVKVENLIELLKMAEHSRRVRASLKGESE